MKNRSEVKKARQHAHPPDPPPAPESSKRFDEPAPLATAQAAVLGDNPNPFDFPNANRAKVSILRPDLARVVETVFIDNIFEEWKHLEAALQLGEKRAEHAHQIVAIDKAAARAYRAHRLYITARDVREAWELENEPIFSAMWSEATRDLQREKNSGARSKQITDADVKARCATMFPDEYRAQEDRRRKLELTVKSLERLAGLWEGRQGDLRSMVSKQRG
jgi:hypothetical protein